LASRSAAGNAIDRVPRAGRDEDIMADHAGSAHIIRESKVPEVTLGFWIVKIAATTLGETVTMTLNWGYLAGTCLFLVAMIVLIAAQIRARLLLIPQRAGQYPGDRQAAERA
jgi:hypothetical protein